MGVSDGPTPDQTSVLKEIIDLRELELRHFWLISVPGLRSDQRSHANGTRAMGFFLFSNLRFLALKSFLLIQIVQVKKKVCSFDHQTTLSPPYQSYRSCPSSVKLPESSSVSAEKVSTRTDDNSGSFALFRFDFHFRYSIKMCYHSVTIDVASSTAVRAG